MLAKDTFECHNTHCGATVEQGVTRVYVDAEGNLKCEACPSVVDGKVVR